ncbi:NGG1p interacting factor NIF3 [bacterium]|nr:NGG1p interacting factor NIF3 [bacterium]MBT4121565.1 NGG1p interacting factor NIF3 [bacterium]MBT4335252.1 NGG1p interacting factor NIF3 [bacterium]MBT4495702.1 NGG1p interacting factor NIF3 [bacterium]MBT4763777.1 NGG1p interacting factor NIF3 [bacterium]
MTGKQIYKLAIDLGIKNDLRGSKLVKDRLKRTNDKYNKLGDDEKNEFDNELLNNPYSDTRYFGDLDKKVKRVLTGIDIGTGEVMLANKLSEKKSIDLIIAHHPEGSGLAALGEVMSMQAEVLATYGVPINIAENLIKMRMSEVGRAVAPANHYQAIDAAELLDMPLMCCHTPADNLVATFLSNYIKKNQKKLTYVEDLVSLLKDIPEYKQAIQMKAGPRLFTGKNDNYLGKIAVTEITGGTSGHKDIYKHMANAGIGTIVAMHMKEEHREEASKAHLNIVIAGHMSSDSIGMNLFLDELEKKGVEVIPCSGIIRHKRFKKK